jgi:SAM-dependent methyltransferase
MAANTTTYPLIENQLESQRLALQARAWQPAAELLFDEIRVRPGWRCIDVGCGPVGVLEPLSRRVGSSGSVTGLDLNPRFLCGPARRNVSLICGDAFAPPPGVGNFDLTHARFVLAPLGRHVDLVRTMLAMTRNDGIVAVEEPDACSWKLLPESGCFHDLVQAILAGFATTGADFSAGRRLPHVFAQAGVEDTQVRASVLALDRDNPYLEMPLQMAENLRDRILQHRILREGELDMLIALCRDQLSSARCYGLSFTLVQAWGRKPDHDSR